MTEQTSQVHPSPQAASGPADQPPGKSPSHPGPSPLDIPARPAPPKAAPPRPASSVQHTAPAQQGASQPGAHSPRPPAQAASAPQTAGSGAAGGATSQAAGAAGQLPAIKARVSGAQALVMAMEQIGVEVVFGIPGGAVLPAYDPLLDSDKIRHILVRHEQGAGHAATGYAQATGRVGVCMATSGPGATNLVTPLADAYMDSVPLVAITGQVPSGAIGTDAFQEADICGITMPITKHNFLVQDPAEIPRTLAEAFHIASTGRPGPVLVDVPKDVLQARTEFAWPPTMELPGYRPTLQPHGKQIRE